MTQQTTPSKRIAHLETLGLAATVIGGIRKELEHIAPPALIWQIKDLEQTLRKLKSELCASNCEGGTREAVAAKGR
jgi:hypothetical protein